MQRDKYTKISKIADELGITGRAVSNYLYDLREIYPTQVYGNVGKFGGVGWDEEMAK